MLLFRIQSNSLLLATTLDLGNNTSIITFHKAAALASQVTEVLLYCSCKQLTSCHTKRCKCFKLGARCTNYCHRSTDASDDCPNIAPPADRNSRILIPRCLPNAVHSISGILSATSNSTSDSDSTTTERHTIPLSQSVHSIATTRLTRSQIHAIDTSVSPPAVPSSTTTANYSPSASPSDTIIVRHL